VANLSLRDTAPGAGRDFRVERGLWGREPPRLSLSLALSIVRSLPNAYPSLSKLLTYSWCNLLLAGFGDWVDGEGYASHWTLPLFVIFLGLRLKVFQPDVEVRLDENHGPK